MRHSLACVVLALVGCRDFAGDLNRLGFVSNLQIRQDEKWTPDHPIAAGTSAVFSAVERVGREPEDDPIDVSGRASGTTLQSEWTKDGLVVTAPSRARGIVRFEGELEDQFRVEFAPVAAADLVDAVEDLGIDHADIALVPGTSAVLWPQLTDRRGRVLGFDPQEISVSAEGAISAWVENGEAHVSADGLAGQDGSIKLGYADHGVSDVPIVLVSADAVSDFTLHPQTWVNDDQVAVIVAAAVWLDDDTRIIGAPVEWTWEGAWSVEDAERTDVLVLSGTRATARPTTIHAKLGGVEREIVVTP